MIRKVQTIEIDDTSKRYLGEVDYFKENGLPKNCIFDKQKVGSGGTSLALNSKHPYVVAVPYVSMIENKRQQKPDEIFGVYGEVKKEDLYDYLDSVDIPKIMVTYDSLEKLTEWLECPEDYKLLVDELHLLFTQYSFRHDAVQKVLQNYTRYKEYCFMTATVLEEEFILDELSELPIVKAEWKNVKTVKVNSIRCNYSVSSTVAKIIEEFLSGERFGDAYFFINSVKFIKEMVKICKLDDSNCMAVWSKNNKEANVGVKNSNSYDTPKKINFFTSCTFEGSDLYGKYGNIFVISDGNKENSLIDISTSFQQIAGRIRDTIFKYNITHLFTNTRYEIDVTYDQFKKKTDEDTLKAKRAEANLRALDEETLSFITTIDDNYLNIRDGVVMFDPNLLKIDLYNFKICQHLYSLRVNLNEEYFKNGFDYQELVDKTLPIARMDRIPINFKDVVLELEKNPDDKELYYAAYKKYDFLEEAINRLDFKGIRQLRFNIGKVKENLLIEEDLNLESKINKGIRSKIKLKAGVFYPSNELKPIIQEVYDLLNIDRNAKATDIEKYFSVEYKTKSIEGKNVKGFIYFGRKVF
jgi:hypothetical protein